MGNKGKVQFVAQAMLPKRCSDIRDKDKGEERKMRENCNTWEAICDAQAGKDVFVFYSEKGAFPGKHGIWESYSITQCKEMAAAAASMPAMWGAPLIKKGSASSSVASGGTSSASGADDSQSSKGVRWVKNVECNPGYICTISMFENGEVQAPYQLKSKPIAKLFFDYRPMILKAQNAKNKAEEDRLTKERNEKVLAEYNKLEKRELNVEDYRKR